MIGGNSGVKMKAEKRPWNMCTDAEWQQEDKKCKGKAVWRRQVGRKRVKNGKKRWRRCRCEDVTQALLHTDALTYRRTYPETFLHTDAFTHGRFYIQTLLHTGAAHKHFYTQTLLHTDALHTDAFEQTLCVTQTLLHTYTFTHKNAFTHRLL